MRVSRIIQNHPRFSRCRSAKDHPCRSTPSSKRMITPEDIDRAVREAMESQEQDVVASVSNWDVVHELVVHYQRQEAKKRRAREEFDPLVDFCKEDPSADECRVYE